MGRDEFVAWLLLAGFEPEEPGFIHPGQQCSVCFYGYYGPHHCVWWWRHEPHTGNTTYQEFIDYWIERHNTCNQQPE